MDVTVSILEDSSYLLRERERERERERDFEISRFQNLRVRFEVIHWC